MCNIYDYRTIMIHSPIVTNALAIRIMLIIWHVAIEVVPQIAPVVPSYTKWGSLTWYSLGRRFLVDIEEGWNGDIASKCSESSNWWCNLKIAQMGLNCNTLFPDLFSCYSTPNDIDLPHWPEFNLQDLQYKDISLDLPNLRALKPSEANFWNNYLPRIITFTGRWCRLSH